MRWLRCSSLSVILIAIALPMVASVYGDEWLEMPYRVGVWLAEDPGASVVHAGEGRKQFIGLDQRIQGELLRMATPIMSVQATRCPESFAHDLRAGIAPYTSPSLGSNSEVLRDLDKLMVILQRVKSGRTSYTIWQFTSVTGSWEEPVNVELAVDGRHETDIALWITRIFLHTVRLARIRDDSAILQCRSGLLIEESGVGSFPGENAMFEPFYARAGKAPLDAAQLPDVDRIPWTVLRVKEGSRVLLPCEVVSGLGNALRNRTPGRNARYAVESRPRRTSTILRLETLPSPGKALAAYGVWSRQPGEKTGEFLGRTDFQAEIEIESGGTPLQVILVQNGNQVLARLPMIIGARQRVTAYLPDDDPRMQVEGIIRGVQERIIDATARRKVMLARARVQLLRGNPEGAEQIWGKLRDGVSRDDFVRELVERQRSSTSPNKAVQARIDQLFSRTRQLIQQQPWDDAEVAKLQQEIAQARASKGQNAKDGGR